MNKIIKYVAVLCLLIVSQRTFSQTAEETLEWLNINKHKVDNRLCYSNYVSRDNGNIIEFEADRVRIRNKNHTGKNFILYKDIKKIEEADIHQLRIISNEKIENDQIFILFELEDLSWRDKFYKAIENMAKLAGAKLVKADLF